MLTIGSIAPPFTLNNELGASVALAQLLARGPVVLMFYPADSTLICTKQACMVRDAALPESLTVVGMSPQNGASKVAFRAAHSLAHMLLADPGSRIAALYKAGGIFGLPLPWGTMRVSYAVNTDSTIADAVHSEASLAPHEALLRRAAERASAKAAIA